MGLPDFSRMHGRDGGDGFRDGFNDGFNEDFDDGFNDGFNDRSGNETDDGFSNDTSEGFSNEEKKDLSDTDLPGNSFSPESEQTGNDSGDSAEKSRNRNHAGLKDAFSALFQAISGRFSGGEKPAGDKGIDGADNTFAHDFDSAVDDGFEPGQESASESDRESGDAEPPQAVETQSGSDDDSYRSQRELPPENPYAGMSIGSRNYPDRESRFAERESERYTGTPSFNDDRHSGNSGRYGNYGNYRNYGSYGHDDNAGRTGRYRRSGDQEENDGNQSNQSTHAVEDEIPEGTASGVMAAVFDALGRLRKRLPSFRPKVYVVPEPDYKPEDDGIGTPTLASDIQKILEAQNKPGETEQEYDRMRSYIRSVSTDTRIRPGDIKEPENIGEVRAAESELYDLIDSIMSTNEQQRSRIGVYEKPPEEDPYNFRGINNERQYFDDTDAYSFNMAPRYGFESEEKIDPGRKQAEMEYTQSLQFSDDGFDDDFEPYMDNDNAAAENGSDLSNGLPDHASDGYSRETDDSLADDFGDDSEPAEVGTGDDLGDIDEWNDDRILDSPSDESQTGRESREGKRRIVHPAPNALNEKALADDRTRRSGKRKATVRRRPSR